MVPCSESTMIEAERNGVEGNGGLLHRKEKRKMLKRMKRKEKRKDVALKERQEAEMKFNDPEEQKMIEALEREERERVDRERKEFEERERLWMDKIMIKRKEEEEVEAQHHTEEVELEKDLLVQDGSDTFEYVEEGPAEIIWQGNEIIVKKKKVKVPKKKADQTNNKEAELPTSNPLPPQGERYTDFLDAPVFSAQQAYDNLAQQVPSFGTEQDKAHCPFHIKTGVCRFGSRCNRAHLYPDKSCTLLIKNMYSGPGLAWEQDEALELPRNSFPRHTGCSFLYTEEEVERSFEEFYEDVHTEFLKFGEIINFKVCRNGSAHLRGNVYVHYKLLDSALLAYHSINGRFFAGKQVKCEYVGLTRWKIAICGEYMKTQLSTCSRGTTCNFIHCFRNPGGDYEWADWDKAPPKYWVNKMFALFGGYTYDSIDEIRAGSPSQLSDKNSLRTTTSDAKRYHHSKRSRSRVKVSSSHSSHSDHYKRIGHGGDTQRLRHNPDGRRNPRDTSERDCMDTMMLRNSSRGLISLSRKNLDHQTRHERFTFSDDEVYEDDAARDGSNREFLRATRCSQVCNRSRNEVEVTKDSNTMHSRICGSEDESNENGGLDLDLVKGSCRYHCGRTRPERRNKDKRCSTNWDRSRDEEEEEKEGEQRLTHKNREGSSDDGKRNRAIDTISLEHMGHDGDVNNHRYEKESGHDGRRKRSRSSELIRYMAELSNIGSKEDVHHQSNSPIYLENETAGFEDRWDPSWQ